jgi:GxxExxY protein
VEYKGVKLDCGYRADIIIDGTILLEIKAIDSLLPVHDAQLLTYLRLAGGR